MILLFYPDPPVLRWRLVSAGAALAGTGEREGDRWTEAVTGLLEQERELEAIGCFLHNGGERLTLAAEPVTPTTVRRVEEVVPLLPEHNGMTSEVLRLCRGRRPDLPHVLLCDTAFFAHLPAVVRDYALPYAVTQKGLHRYGGSGLCHEEMWKHAQALTAGTAGKLISVYLGDRPDMAAIQDGSPVETTVGLTHVEGLMSSRACGDIDPTIIFRLAAEGLSYAEINRLLSTKSGFSAVAGRACHLADLTGGSTEPGLVAARRLLTYQLVKSLGAMLASLDGADALAFAGDDLDQVMPLVHDLCEALGFLGVRCRPGAAGSESPRRISTRDSALAVFVSGYDPWHIMNERVREVLEKERERL